MDSYRLNELPNTTAKYQTYTNNFEDWLLKTAAQRGLELHTAAKEATQKHATDGKKKKKRTRVGVRRLIELAKGIAESDVPLEDTSGLNDLSDAIRSRREVTEWHRFNGSSDKTHPFFTSKLMEVRDIFSSFVRRTIYRDHDVVDERPNHIIVIQTTNDPAFELDESDGEKEKVTIILSTELQMPGSFRWSHKKIKKTYTTSHKESSVSTWSQGEIELEQDFKVLCFLYDLNQLRQFDRQAWRDYGTRKINIVTASLVTDLVLGIIQRNVDALAEDLEETGERSLAIIVKKLYANTPTPEMADLLCMEAVRHMDEYQRLKQTAIDNVSSTFSDAEFPYMPFLLFFDNIRDNKFVCPEMDNFTEAMFTSTAGSEPWLPFGLQIIVDLQPNSAEEIENREAWTDLTHDAITLATMMRDHCNYEDDMWKMDIRPDYMSQGETKFSNFFLQPCSDILEWVNQVIKKDEPGASITFHDRGNFLSMNPMLIGLVMYSFQKQYQSMSIQKIQWFVVSLSHLYNAARQIGGLNVPWPDLEFIISTQGKERIFAGDLPTDPDLFIGRLIMGMCTSARALAKDRRGKKWTKASKEARDKRGLLEYLPLQEKIKEYYGPNDNDDRWIRLHNLFVHVFKNKGLDTGLNNNMTLEYVRELEDTFTTIATSIAPPKPARKNRKQRKKPKVTTPDFATLESEYVGLLSNMKNRLRDDEIHSEFDYLSFYRRAFAFLLEIRGEVLYDSETALRRLDSKLENITNLELLFNLLHGLKGQPNKNAKPKRNDESVEVVAMEQLQRISKILEQLIEDEGSVEIDKAEARLRRWWDVVEPACPLRMVKIPKGIYHRFTFSSTASRKRKVFIQHLSGIPVLNIWTVRKCLPVHLIGKKKHRVAFKCLGHCSMAKACLGLPSKLSALKEDPGIWDGFEEIEDVSEFDYDSDDDDLNWEEAPEFLGLELPSMPGAYSKEFFDCGLPSMVGMFPEDVVGPEAGSMFTSLDEFLGNQQPFIVRT